MEWTITTDQLASLTGVQFTYHSGDHRLDMQSVQIVADGTVVAEEVHDGNIGTASTKNIY